MVFIIFKIIFFAIALILIFVSTWKISLLFYIPIILALYWCLFYWLKVLYNKYIKIQPTGWFLYFLWNSILTSGASLGVMIWLLFTFCYYNNDLNPAVIPIYTVTNWDKIIKFQAMSHIWTENFYNNVKINVLDYKKSWYVLYFEWVKSWSGENVEKFNHILWIEFTKDLYENMSKIYWLKDQNTRDYLWLVNNNDFNVDVSLNDLIELYEKKYWKINLDTNNTGNIIPNVSWNMLKTLDSFNEKELNTFRYINKWIMNFFTKNPKVQSYLVDVIWKNEVMDIILNERNKVIADKIINSQDKQILLTYWALHFNWVFELLKKSDNRWNIVWTQYIYPFK